MYFKSLQLLVDPVPRSAAFNMALDEVLLVQTPCPLLRVYTWERPSVSYGYFEPWEPVAVAYPGRDLVRRWTGGGVVTHGDDWTYSLIVPRAEPFSRLKAAESYRLIHDLLADTLRACASVGDEIQLTPASFEKISHACFENPAQYDILVGGRKIAGAAQRRSRYGLLHQGSVQGVQVPNDFPGRFADRFTKTCLPGLISPAAEEAAAALAEAKYATAAWNQKF